MVTLNDSTMPSDFLLFQKNPWFHRQNRIGFDINCQKKNCIIVNNDRKFFLKKSDFDQPFFKIWSEDYPCYWLFPLAASLLISPPLPVCLLLISSDIYVEEILEIFCAVHKAIAV